jgi:undecaprenyl-diphosphatase
VETQKDEASSMDQIPPTNLLGKLRHVWRQRVDLIALVAVLMVVGAIWFFDELANNVTAGHTQRFDDWVIDSLRNPHNPGLPCGPIWLVEAGRDVTALGSPTIVALTIVAVAGYLALKRRFGPLLLTVLAASSGALFSTMIKRHFERPRPHFGSDLVTPLSSSFPSGHSMLSAVVYLLLGAMLARGEPRWPVKLYFVGLAMLLTFMVGLSRIYLGVHYPSDVLAGWTAGLGWASAWWLVARWLEGQRVR